MGPVCRCGCGESLPENSVREYKRGHKARAIKEENLLLAKNDDPFPGVPSISDEPELKGIFKAAKEIPDDPESATMRKNFKSAPKIKVTQGVRSDVEGKVAFMLIATANAVQLIDPVCGGVLAEQTADIAAKLTPVLCQSSAVVQWFQKGTSLIMYVDLLMVLMPVLATFYSHHISRAVEMAPPVAFDDSYYGVR